MKDALNRISHSLPEMALITGVLVRVVHVVCNAYGIVNGGELGWLAFLGTMIVAPILVLAMAAVHLSNYPVTQWLWRAPVFALAEIVVEALTSLALIAAGRERWGSGRADMADWPLIAGGILVWRFIIICAFALILGAIVQWVRRREFAAEGRHIAASGPPPGMPERRRHTPTN